MKPLLMITFDQIVKKYNIPAVIKSVDLLMRAEKSNPGPWVSHSLNVAEAAAIIASYHPELSKDQACCSGLLHDIGRRHGMSYMRHTIDGYNYLIKENMPLQARIAISHSFPSNEFIYYIGKQDCTETELNFIKTFVKETQYNDYDELIQLCDCLALPSGFCILEKRFVDVTLRYGFNDHTTLRWKAIFAIKEKFEQLIDKKIYDLLPGIAENTLMN